LRGAFNQGDVMERETDRPSGLLELINEKWCFKPMCGTCGNLAYKEALREFRKTSSADPIDLLARIDPNDFQFQRFWGNGLVILREHLMLGEDGLDRVLSSWLDHDSLPVRLLDEVLYHVRPSGEIGEKWIERSIQSAVASQDCSLIETLLIELGEEVHAYPDLITAAFKNEQRSKRIKRLLKRIGGFDYLP
jgi:hypothetical protein